LFAAVTTKAMEGMGDHQHLQAASGALRS
jgi:hypothetical protein